jgi:hypothetical protein
VRVVAVDAILQKPPEKVFAGSKVGEYGVHDESHQNCCENQ